MGTIIDCATVAHTSWRSRHSALRIAVAAARACLDKAGCRPNDLDLLINAGIYRDRNLGEPALAALIQEDVGANPEDPHPGAHGTFSCDVANGVCGPLTALQIVDGFLRSGAISRALVVASDADPGHHLTEEPFPFAGAGGALLCHGTDDDSGFGVFCWANSPDRSSSFRATVTYHDGRNRLRIEARDPTMTCRPRLPRRWPSSAWTVRRSTSIRSASCLPLRLGRASPTVSRLISAFLWSASLSLVRTAYTPPPSLPRSTTRTPRPACSPATRFCSSRPIPA
jgi:hypothetical protein